MSRTPTTRLALSKPDPGTAEPYDASVDLGSNWDKVDAAISATECTSSTRPTGADAWDGRIIIESDTNKAYVREDGNWRQIVINTGTSVPIDDDVSITGTLTVSSSASVNTLTVTGSGVINSINIANLPRGIIARAERTTASGTTTAADAGVLRLDNIPYLSGRAYKIWTTVLHLDSSVANDEIRARLRQDVAGAAATVSSAILPGSTAHARQVDQNVSETDPIQTTYHPGSNQTGSILLCVGRIAGSGNVRLANSDSDELIGIYVEDMGLAVSDTGVDI